MQFADRLHHVETSAIRELFKLLGKPGIISFAGGFPDAALFDVEGIGEAAAAALAQQPATALQYGATEGLEALRAQLAQMMNEKTQLALSRVTASASEIEASAVRPEQLIVTTGSQQALDLVGKTLLGPGDRAVVEAPTFLATIQCFRLYGAQLLTVPLDAQGVDVQVLERVVAEQRPKLVYLIPTFGNPSGATLTIERRLAVLEMTVRHGVVLVEDDPYGDLYFDQPPPPSLLALSARVPGSRDWLVHCGSLSKVLAPGLRLGWMVAPAALLAKATMCKQFSDAHTSTLAQATAARYLQSGRLAAAVARVRAVYAERAQAMAEALEQQLGEALQFTRPQGGMFVWARLTGAGGRLRDGQVLAQRAIAHGVAFVPGAPFYASAPDGATLRLSFATVGTDGITEGVRRLAAALDEISA